MTTLLRRSGNLARLSQTSPHPNTCLCSSYTRQSLKKVSRLQATQSRLYATGKPGDANDTKYDARPRAEPGSLAKNGKKLGRAPKGFEQLYSNGGPLSGTPKGPHFQGLPVPWPYKVTENERKALDGICASLKKGLPTSQHKILEVAVEEIKRRGMPQEIREIFDKLESGAPLDLLTGAKLFKLTIKWARRSGEHIAQVQDRLERQAQGDRQRQKKQDSDGFKLGEMNIDTTTLVVSLFTGYLLYRMLVPSENQKDITWQEFRTTFFDKGLVNKLTVVNGSRVRVELHREATAQMYPESPAQYANFSYYFTVGSVEAFERRLDEAQDDLDIPSFERIPVSYVNEYSWFGGFISIAPTFFLIGFLYWMTKRAGGGGSGGGSSIFGIGKSRAKRFNHESAVQTKFKDVAGMDEAKAEIMEFVSFLKSPGQYQRLGAKIPRGAILSGPPGTGKTLLAKATAGESQVPFFSVSGSEFVEMFVGVGPSRVRDLFANARKNTPCIIFIDEIDAIGKARGKGKFSGGNDERESTLNQILTEMDGFNTSEQVVVLAGTNRPDVLDKALLRPGRFDRHITIDRPTMQGRKQIFLVHLRRIVTDENLDYLTGRLSALTPGFSGADIANCVNEAALIGTFSSPASFNLKSTNSPLSRSHQGRQSSHVTL